VAILVVEADFVFAETFALAPQLRLVGVCRNALNQVDVESATAHGVAVTHTPGRNTNAVAELTIACMLALARRIVPASALVSDGGWRDPAVGYRTLRGREMAGATVGVVGFGQIGREVTRKLLALDCDIVVHDPLVPVRDIEAIGGRAAPLLELAAAADFVTVHVPDGDATRHLVDGVFLSHVKAGSYLVNTSAGGVIEDQAIVDALRSGRLAGAALDVYEGYPLPSSSPLLSAPNVLLTPHIGGATDETVGRHSRTIVEEIERMLDGQPLLHAVNRGCELVRAQ
jgi:phosphoglycerate dehydrogenase-like enzyme